MFEQKGEGRVNRCSIKHVVIVEHKDEAVRGGSDVIEQGRQQRVGRRWLRRLERTYHSCADGRHDRAQSGDEVRQKACEFVLPFVQRQPGDRSLAAGQPVADQRGLAEADWGRDERQLAVRPRVQPLTQAGAAGDVRPT